MYWDNKGELKPHNPPYFYTNSVFVSTPMIDQVLDWFYNTYKMHGYIERYEQGWAYNIVRGEYEFDGKYLFSASVRREGISSFQEVKRWGIFPAVSAGWVVSNEDFFKEIKHLNYFKLRGGYGEVANGNTGNALNNLVFASGFNYAFGPDQQIFPGSNIPYQVDPNFVLGNHERN
jgi:hypothetical protein